MIRMALTMLGLPVLVVGGWVTVLLLWSAGVR